MKETLYTIPLNDAVAADDECPFCFIEREVEQNLLDFVLGSGSSYMESDVRAATDAAGFCREHFHKMFEYGIIEFDETTGLLQMDVENLNEAQKEYIRQITKKTNIDEKHFTENLQQYLQIHNTRLRKQILNHNYSEIQQQEKCDEENN